MSTAITKDTLAELATLGKEGANVVLVLGKVRDITRWPAKDGRAANVSLTVTIGEGLSGKLSLDDAAACPAKGHSGAFLVENCGEYPRGTFKADVVDWA